MRRAVVILAAATCAHAWEYGQAPTEYSETCTALKLTHGGSVLLTPQAHSTLNGADNTSYALGTERLIARGESSIASFQPPMTIRIGDNPTAATACPHLESGHLAWSDASFNPPADGTPISLPASTSVIIRAGMLIGTATSPYGSIAVPSGSRLIFDDTGAGGAALS